MLLAVLLTTGCKQSEMPEENAVYYWRTEWQTDSLERAFLQQYHINKVYCRYFDVVMNSDGEPMPNATIRFVQGQQDGIKFIPTVFITENCMHQPHKGLAKKLVDRIVQMNETNDISGVDEVQIDCDFTARNRKNYYDFLQQVRDEAKKHGMRLSTTIRLHQLASTPPPADRGVLMMYNTGDFTDINCEKPILDTEVAVPYLKNLSSYPLPLSAAYPLYSWKILFRQKKFVGIMYSDDEYPILPTDSIIIRSVTVEEILKAKACLQKHRPDINSEIILYELNNKNITKFKDHEYKEIFAR